MSKLQLFHFSNIMGMAYLINKTESPAKSLFPLTNKLQPVVSKCRFGWPVIKKEQELVLCYLGMRLINIHLQKKVYANIHMNSTSDYFGIGNLDQSS